MFLYICSAPLLYTPVSPYRAGEHRGERAVLTTLRLQKRHGETTLVRIWDAKKIVPSLLLHLPSGLQEEINPCFYDNCVDYSINEFCPDIMPRKQVKWTALL